MLTRVRNASTNAVISDYRYDPMLRQRQKAVGSTKTNFYYAGWQRLADYDGTAGTLQNRYVYGTSLDEILIQVASSGTKTYYHANNQGSIIATTNSSGAIINRYKFGPFGESTALVGTTHGYTGQRYDAETGLYYYKMRYYAPKIGRFLQPDPIGMAGGMNFYGYCGSNPILYTDTMGLAADGGSGADSGNGGGRIVNTFVDESVLYEPKGANGGPTHKDIGLYGGVQEEFNELGHPKRHRLRYLDVYYDTYSTRIYTRFGEWINTPDWGAWVMEDQKNAFHKVIAAGDYNDPSNQFVIGFQSAAIWQWDAPGATGYIMDEGTDPFLRRTVQFVRLSEETAKNTIELLKKKTGYVFSEKAGYNLFCYNCRNYAEELFLKIALASGNEIENF